MKILRLKMLMLAGALAVWMPCALAQHGGPPGGGPPGGGGGGMSRRGGAQPNPGGGMQSGDLQPRMNSGRRGGSLSGGPGPNTMPMRGGLQLGPPGRWWDDRSFVRALNLRKDQQKRMDAAFNANRAAIVEGYKSLQMQESRLASASRENTPDENKIFAAIDGVNQARAALAKTYAHMLMQVRQEMDADQISKMGKLQDTSAEE